MRRRLNLLFPDSTVRLEGVLGQTSLVAGLENLLNTKNARGGCRRSGYWQDASGDRGVLPGCKNAASQDWVGEPCRSQTTCRN